MRLQALRARPRRRRLPKDDGDRQIASMPLNQLDRQFAAEQPNLKWIADFSYIWTAEGWLYVSAVIDLYSRRVIGWSMSASMTAQLVADALLMACGGVAEALMHHPDRGSQYASDQFQRLMADSGIVCSMSRSGNVGQRGGGELLLVAEDRAHRAKNLSHQDEAKAVVFDYIERFYNAVRHHSTIGYISPVESERKLGFA